MSYHSDYNTGSGTGRAFCDGVKGITNFMLHQHIPRTYRRMNEYLPHHLYYDQETAPFDMRSVPASNICNRAVIKRFVYMKQEGGQHGKISPRSIAWMPQNDYIVTAWNNGTIIRFESVTGNMNTQRNFSNMSINSLRVSHNGKFLIAAELSGKVSFLSPELTAESSSKKTIMENDEVRDCAISANDNFVITGGKSKILRAYTVNNEGLSYYRDVGEHNHTITSIASSAVSSMLLSGSEDTTMHIWDLRQKQCSVRKLQNHTDVVNKVLFCPTNENLILSASSDKTIRLYDIRTFCCVNTYTGHQQHVITAAFNPADGTLFTSGDYYGSLNFYSIYHKDPLYTVNRAHGKSIRDICYNPMGISMVTIGDDSVIRFWERNRPGDREELIAGYFTQFKIPRNRETYQTTPQSFAMSRTIPSLGTIHDNSVTTINMTAPTQTERPLAMEEQHEQVKDFLEDDAMVPPRNALCIKCNYNGHWPHDCPNVKSGRRNYPITCNKCQGAHTSDVCPYRYDVGSYYVCNLCKGKGHRIEDCPKKLSCKKKIVTAGMKYTNKIREQEGQLPSANGTA